MELADAKHIPQTHCAFQGARMMADSPYIPFYPSDWLAGTRGLSAAETGVYITILCMIYEREAPLDMPRDRLARLCGCTVTNFERALSALIDGGKLIIKDGGLWNKRAECELELRSSKRSNAKRSANARWEKPKEKQGAIDASASIPQCENDANQNQNQNHIEEGIDANASIVLSAPAPPLPLADAVTCYNEAAAQVGWPQVQKLTPARSAALKARLRDCGGIEGWRVAMDKAKASDFLTGRSHKPWTGFGFDWITKQANFSKLMEGNYDNRTGDVSGSNARGKRPGMVDAFAAVAARRAARPH
jgi:uncharacterized protein YdaU (DUF1376 family)